LEKVSGSLLLALPGWCLEIQVAMPAPATPGAINKQALALFDTLDANKDGYLDSKEAFRPPFRMVAMMRLADRDGDNKVSKKEFTEFMKLQGKLQGVISFLRVEDRGQSLFEMIDSNGDNRLSQREMKAAWKRLAPWMKDGKLSKDQLPRVYRLIVRQGRPVVQMTRFGRRVPPPLARGPLWFRKMDRNGDGDVSPAEWLGTAAQFKKID